MDATETTEGICRRIVAANLHLDLAAVTLASKFEDDLGADSLDVVEICMEIEDELHIDSDLDDTITPDNTFGELVALAEQRRKH